MAEISTPQGLAWRSAPRALTFYLLFAFGIAQYFYNRALYRHDVAIDRFLDDDFCKAYMRSQCLPEAAQRYRELIRRGDVGQLERALTEVKRILE